MFYPDSFRVSTPSDREIQVTRDFGAPRHLVFDAFTKPDLVKRWLLGPPGWSMPVCNIDLRVGGTYRYMWRQDSDGQEMGMGGVFREIVTTERLVATEKFDQAWYSGEALDTTEFLELGEMTRTVITVQYESKEARDTAQRSGMEHGMAASYDRAEELLAELQKGEDLKLIETPQITETVAQAVAAIHLTIPRSEMRSAVGPGVGEAMAAVKNQGKEQTGPWFTHHLKIEPGIFDFEICVPVKTAVEETGRVKAMEVAGGKIIRTVYSGPYERLGEAWGEFDSWIATKGYRACSDLYERYEVGPESGMKPPQWRTELSRRLQ